MSAEQIPEAISFEDEKALNKLDLILDDIQVASKQLSNLNKEYESLTTQVKDADFLLNELTLEIESLQDTNITQLAEPPQPKPKENGEEEDEPLPIEKQFFTYWNSLETRETEVNARIEANVQLKADLAHSFSALKQKNQKLKKELELLQNSVEEENNEIRKQLDLKEQLQVTLDQKVTENEEILMQCTTLKEELDARNEELQQFGVEKVQAMRLEYQQKREKLSTLKQEAEHKRREFESTQRKNQKQFQTERKKLENESSVAQWKTSRSILKNKLANLKSQLQGKETNLVQLQKKEKTLEQNYSNLLDTEHNFGDCEKARKCIQAQLNELIQKNEEVNQINNDQYEDEYAQQLEKEYQAVILSQNMFNEYKDSVLGGLHEELNGCSQVGYIKMLREELAELQSQLNKLL